MPIWLSLLSALYLTGVWAILKKRAKDTNDQTLDRIVSYAYVVGLMLFFLIGYLWDK